MQSSETDNFDFYNIFFEKDHPPTVDPDKFNIEPWHKGFKWVTPEMQLIYTLLDNKENHYAIGMLEPNYYQEELRSTATGMSGPTGPTGAFGCRGDTGIGLSPQIAKVDSRFQTLKITFSKEFTRNEMEMLKKKFAEFCVSSSPKGNSCKLVRFHEIKESIAIVNHYGLLKKPFFDEVKGYLGLTDDEMLGYKMLSEYYDETRCDFTGTSRTINFDFVDKVEYQEDAEYIWDYYENTFHSNPTGKWKLQLEIINDDIPDNFHLLKELVDVLK